MRIPPQLPRINGVLIVAVLLLAVPLVARVPMGASAEVLGVRLGDSTVRDVLLELGPADSAFLSGHNAEIPHPSEGDPLVLRFEREFKLLASHEAEVFVYFSANYVAETLTITFDKPVPVEEIAGTFGVGYESLRFRLLGDGDALEGAVSDCVDPSGGYEEWLYPDMYLTVEIGDPNSDHALGLRYSLEHRRYPECKSP